jgi:tripartite-type tricarboxylate transporter receptor subunit TctC
MIRNTFLTLVAILSMSTASAQEFPTENVVLVVPAAAGGPTDVIARLLAGPMGTSLGQKVIVENVPGAGGTLGSARVAAAEPDGHTILLHNLALASAPAIYPDLPYDTTTGFTAVGLANYGPYVLVGNPSLDAADAAALIEKIKKDGTNVTMAHGGDGSAAHLCGALTASQIGSPVTFVPYQGGGPALLDVLGGVVDLMCASISDALPQVEAGKLRAYAVTSPARLTSLPDTPTFGELGLQVDISLWSGIFAPAGTPANRIEILNKAVRAALADTSVTEKFATMGIIIYPPEQQAPQVLQDLLSAEVPRWAAVVEQSRAAQ